jgi:hypothetical protein
MFEFLASVQFCPERHEAEIEISGSASCRELASELPRGGVLLMSTTRAEK